MSELLTVPARTITTTNNNNSNSSMHGSRTKFNVESLQSNSSDKLVPASPPGDSTIPTTSSLTSALTSEENQSFGTNSANVATSWSESIQSFCSSVPSVPQLASSMFQPSSEENVDTSAAASTLSPRTPDEHRGTIFIFLWCSCSKLCFHQFLWIE